MHKDREYFCTSHTQHQQRSNGLLLFIRFISVQLVSRFPRVKTSKQIDDMRAGIIRRPVRLVGTLCLLEQLRAGTGDNGDQSQGEQMPTPRLQRNQELLKAINNQLRGCPALIAGTLGYTNPSLLVSIRRSIGTKACGFIIASDSILTCSRLGRTP